MGLAINLVILPKKEREFIGLTMSKHHCHQYSAWYEESELEIFFQRERESGHSGQSQVFIQDHSLPPLEPRGAVGISSHHRQQRIMVWLMVSSDMWYANLPTSGPRLWVPRHWTRHFENSLRHDRHGQQQRPNIYRKSKCLPKNEVFCRYSQIRRSIQGFPWQPWDDDCKCWPIGMPCSGADLTPETRCVGSGRSA